MTIYFQCPRPSAPSGGVWYIHRLVELLNQMGHSARVWTPQPFAVWWSAHPVNQEFVVQSIQPGQGDTLIIPEVLWPPVSLPGVREIAFVQNYIWLSNSAFMDHPADVLVCSRFLANHMERVFHANVVGKITPFLDDDVWPVPPHPKQANRVLLIARRNPYHAAMRSALERDGFTVDYVTEPLSQTDLAEHLRQAEFYIHLVHPEGFPMACLEAMRSGTIVVGTTGGGGVEFMHHQETAVCVQDPENGRYGNAQEFINRIMDSMNYLRDHPEDRSRIWQTAFDWSKRYTAEATMKELKAVFG